MTIVSPFLQEITLNVNGLIPQSKDSVAEWIKKNATYVVYKRLTLDIKTHVTEDTILYVENSKAFTKKIVRTNKFRKVARNKIDTHDSIVFLCTFNVQSVKTIKKIPFMGVSQKMKYLGIKQTKEVKDLCRKNCKTLHKEIKDTNKLKENPCSWIGKVNILKLSILPTVIYRFNEMCIKIPKAIFSELEKNFKIHMEFQRTPPPPQ